MTFSSGFCLSSDDVTDDGLFSVSIRRCRDAPACTAAGPRCFLHEGLDIIV